MVGGSQQNHIAQQAAFGAYGRNRHQQLGQFGRRANLFELGERTAQLPGLVFHKFPFSRIIVAVEV